MYSCGANSVSSVIRYFMPRLIDQFHLVSCNALSYANQMSVIAAVAVNTVELMFSCLINIENVKERSN